MDGVFGVSFARKVPDIQKILPQIQDLSVGYTLKRISRTTLYDVDKDSETQKLTIIDVLNEDTSFGFAETAGWGVDVGFLGKRRYLESGKGNGALPAITSARTSTAYPRSSRPRITRSSPGPEKCICWSRSRRALASPSRTRS